MKRKFAVTALTNWIYNWYRSTIRHPKWRWWLILGSLVYLLDPFDFLPDMIPIVGWIDDGMIATVLIAEVSQMMSDRRKAQKEQLLASTPNGSSTAV